MNRQWKGYTLDEIRAQRTLNKQRIEAEKQRLLNPVPAQAPTQGLMQRNGPLGNIAGALDYVDYAVMTFNITKRIIGYFRNRKKS